MRNTFLHKAKVNESCSDLHDNLILFVIQDKENNIERPRQSPSTHFIYNVICQHLDDSFF